MMTKFFKVHHFFILATELALAGCAVQAKDIYIAQAAAGANSGQRCVDAYSYSFFNAGSNWGTGASQIGPGTVVHLCGTITTGLTINGSGSAGNVISVVWEPGARISVTYGQIINLNGSKGYLLFDGGIPCGPGTNCDKVESASLRGYTTGQTGIIEATANGSGLANQSSETQAFFGCNGCHDIEIRNLIVRNLYIHNSMTDRGPGGSIDTGNFVFQCPEANSGCAPGLISIHDSTIHDVGNGISMQRGNATTMNAYSLDFYRTNWAMELSGDGTRALNFHDNHMHDAKNWDNNFDDFHHNGVHVYMNKASDSLGVNFYNNLSDGDWGSCCTTAVQLFIEVASPNNFNVFNNVVLQYPGNLAPAWLYGATNGIFANNTAIGSVASGNVAAIEIYASGVNFQNNAVTGYGQFIYVHAGSSFTAIDYNRWGVVGGNGNAPWQWMSTGANTFTAWKTASSGDSHGANLANFGLDPSGSLLEGSALIQSGSNLVGLGITALNSDKAGKARPFSGAWDVGAYQYSIAAATKPPTGLTGVAQ